ncbi:thiamine-monophosphate kinase [Gluconacetobacter diazotrophicus PA1 5]|uniref:Thiamine-monophosphate kinase n=1 Tax=Gluconacetobacter diazotrophicus (strain ATCC 49037 / DSM 5601 / CCUG 37298 / CIP 103539 / LMG 7603 / PAl5) TaxID=272568 RepID=A9HHZ5_GLUDA|nr:thiamine-phosphate kinase [Gluconacetobacter diazotrophicus]ACI53260.1 thiamine-monophosphate kinase [Gluconacetobacter diazotrophicus PA1 5]TWB10363.1 thiamine-phosphate kinase [Gluconacetobacter diazotrophicus]CAP55700.1 putative thiamine-monophosphate kinase [Gluconacetobacter diazotrophicus PA1 5]
MSAALPPAGPLPPEFGFIRRHFLALAGEGALGLTDDAALLRAPAGRELVVAVDTMVEGVHFLPDDPADTVGRKLLRCNLSDLAAMDAMPLGYLLAVTTPPARDEAWFAGFARGLADDQGRYGLSLLGGDTTSTPGPLVLSLTILGHGAPGRALRRNGARDGDGIWVTGTIGDGALGLRALRGEVADPDGFLAGRYRLPRPRLGLGLGGIASAAMDVSDGLVQDLGHLARESGVGARIDAGRVPLSPAARQAGPRWLPTCLTGGDDYELLLAVPPAHEGALREAARTHGVAVTRIGAFDATLSGVQVLDGVGGILALERTGWSHL